MSKMLVILTIFCSVKIFSQNNCSGLERGVFELYEEGIKIGLIYRKNGIQLESYENHPQQYTKAVYKRKGNCSYYLKSYEIKKDIDTITWEVSFTKLENDSFSFVGTPAFIKSGYSYGGKLIKISNRIEDMNIRKLLDKLSKQ